MRRKLGAILLAVTMTVNSLSIPSYAQGISDPSEQIDGQPNQQTDGQDTDEEEGTNDLLSEENADQKTTSFERTAQYGKMMIRLSAEEGVISPNAILRLNPIQDSAQIQSMKAAIDAKRGYHRDSLRSYPVDITLADPAGNKIQPDLTNGKNKPALEIAISEDLTQAANEATKRIKDQVIERTLEGLTPEEKTFAQQIENKYALIDYTVAPADLKVSVYHISDNVCEVLAENKSISDGSKQGYTMNVTVFPTSFSPFVVDVPYPTISQDELDALCQNLKNQLRPAGIMPMNEGDEEKDDDDGEPAPQLAEDCEHEWVEDYSTATCTEAGVVRYHCSLCEEIKEEAAPVSGHSFTDWEIIKAASCEEEGERVRSCVNSHAVIIDEAIVETESCTYQEKEIIPKEEHDYVNHVCTKCGKTYPKIQAIIDQINDLPAADQITAGNAKAFFDEITLIEDKIHYYSSLNPTEGSEEEKLKEACQQLVNTEENMQKLAELKQACRMYLTKTTYRKETGNPASFRIIWNDNKDSKYRSQWETEAGKSQFAEIIEPVISYRIVAANGQTQRTGSFSSCEEANEAFAFLGVHAENLITVDSNGDMSYYIKTDDALPVKYTASVYDYTSGETSEYSYRIEYSIEFKAPAKEDYTDGQIHYIVTSPAEMTNDSIRLSSGQMAMLTLTSDYKAYVQWNDDANRNVDSQGSPRVNIDTLKANTKVYCLEDGYNSSDGKLVTSDYQYLIKEAANPDGPAEIYLQGLPAYDNEGNPLYYYIVQDGEILAANANNVPGNRYVSQYLNNGNFASKTNGVYADGFLIETLTNETEFKVKKIWLDDKQPAERPDTTFSIWSIVPSYDEKGEIIVDREFPFPVPNTPSEYNVPNTSGEFTFERDIDGKANQTFPMYDSMGRKYIYYGKEMDVAGYETELDYSETDLPDNIVKEFEGTGYFLNGTIIKNKANNEMSVPVAKSFKALSIQNKISANKPIKATFLLQKEEDGAWVNATEEDLLSTVEAEDVIVEIDDSQVLVTLTAFSAEKMEADFDGIIACKYKEVTDPATGEISYQKNQFRWVESAVSVNGVQAEYDLTKWKTQEDGSLLYDGQIIVNDGQKSTVLGDKENQTSAAGDTTALFSAIASEDSFENTLLGQSQVDIKKIFYDAENHNISASETLQGATVTFQIMRDGVAIPEDEGGLVTLSQADLSEDQLCWERITTFDRYDSEGREYKFKVEEVRTSGAGSYDFVRTENYDIVVEESPEDSGILIPVLKTTYVNTPRTVNHLYFDVEKNWLDDSDQETRYPVVAALYRFRDIDGNLLETPELISDNILLSKKNNWYTKYTHTTVTGDSVDNYIVIEEGIKVGDKIVHLNQEEQIIDSHVFDQVKPLKDGQTSGFPRAEIGIIGSLDAEGEKWDGLSYRYRSFSEEKDKDEIWADYTLTNLRIGTQDYAFTKNWISGATIKDAEFALYLGQTKVATFKLLVKEDGTGLKDTAVQWEEGFDHDGVTLELVGTGLFRDEDTDNYYTRIIVKGLPKFNELGAQQNYSIKEIAIKSDKKDEQGNEIWKQVENNSCKVDGTNYSVTYDVDIAYAPNNTHRSPDQYEVAISNHVNDSYDLVANKVWRDNLQTARPDVAFSIYRVSMQNSEIRTLVEEIDHAEGEARTQAIQDLVDKLATMKTKDYLVEKDKKWDTKINSYWWECSLKDVARFDENGYPYIYFATEKINAGASAVDTSFDYKGFYSNQTIQEGYRPVNPQVEAGEKLHTKDVFAVSEEQLSAAENSVFILADGIHTGTEGNFSDYYSATAVNKPEGNRIVSGKKIWKFPLGLEIPSLYLPTVESKLYRLLEEVKVSDFEADEDKSSSEKYAQYIEENAEKTIVKETGQESSQLGSQLADAASGYKYNFVTDINGDRLPRFNEWGQRYYYYTLEGLAYANDNQSDANDDQSEEGQEGNALTPLDSIQNFPKNAVVYQDNNYNMTNVFVAENPYAEVTVQKVWEISKKLLDNPGTYITELLSSEDLAPADITLKGSSLDRENNLINNTEVTYADISLNPKTFFLNEKDADGKVRVTDDQGLAVYELLPAYSAEDGKTKIVVRATYTFKKFKNDLVAEGKDPYQYLPYYWTNDCRIQYSLSESVVNGYSILSHGVSNVRFKDLPVQREYGLVYETDYINADEELYPSFNNIYADEPHYKNITFKKIWNDQYVANDAYRPDAIRFVIGRKVSGNVDDSWQKSMIIKKTGTENTWFWEGVMTDLLAYNPEGKAYNYYIVSETFLTKDEDGNYIDGQTASQDGNRSIGKYTLTGITDTALTNQLIEENSISFKKTWTLNGKSVIEWTNDDNSGFSDLRKLGAFPSKVQYILQRSLNGGEYTTVDASNYDEQTRIINYNNKPVLGTEVNYDSATEDNYMESLNTRIVWSHLPIVDIDTGNTYQYRMIEKVFLPNGTSSELIHEEDEIGGIKLQEITSLGDIQDKNNPPKITFVNNLDTDKIRIGKLWNDNHGSENTRPESITVTICPMKDGEPIAQSGVSFELKATKGQTNSNQEYIYYSDYFEIPTTVPKTYGAADSNYQITESFTAKNGAEYTQTITSEGHVYQITDEADGKLGSWVFRIDNTYDADRKVVDLNAYKNWAGDANWKDQIRPNVKFTLQYYDRQTKVWTDITDMSAFSSDADQDATIRVPAQAAEGKQYPGVTWTNMYKYWDWDDNLAEDGIAEAIRYRVIETLCDSNWNPIQTSCYTQDDKKEFSINKVEDSADEEYDVTIKNTLATTSLKVMKNWLDESLYASLVRPVSITFLIKYRFQGEGDDDWKNLPNDFVKMPDNQSASGIDVAANGISTITLSGSNTASSWTKTINELPRYNRDGKTYEYMLREDKITYKLSDSYERIVEVQENNVGPYVISSVDKEADYQNNVFEATFENKMRYSSLTVYKDWEDDANRDGARGEIQVQLYRVPFTSGLLDGLTGNNEPQTVGEVIRLNQSNDWTYTWTCLPVYNNDRMDDTDKAIYYVREVDAQGNPIEQDSTVSRKNSLNEDIEYQVVYQEEDGVELEEDTVEETAIGNIHEAELMSFTAGKDWGSDLDKIKNEIRPDSIKFVLQYSLDNGTTWFDFPADHVLKGNAEVLHDEDLDPTAVYMAADMPADADTSYITNNIITRTLTAPDWQPVSWTNLTAHVQKDGKTVDVQYRAKEIALANYNDASNNFSNVVTHKSNPAEVMVKNNLDNGTLTVAKRFEVNENFNTDGETLARLVEEKVIPETLTVTLTYQDGEETKTETGTITFDSAKKAYGTCEFKNLPVKDRSGNMIKYSVSDSAAGYPEVAFGNNVDFNIAKTGSRQIITNNIQIGSLKVNKTWIDENDRERLRGPVTINLYRDGGETPYRSWQSQGDASLTNWTYTFTDLPIWKSYVKNGENIPSVYRLEEVTEGKTANYTVSWDADQEEYQIDQVWHTANAELTNSYEPATGSITVQKVWKDNNNYYGLRPDEITYALEWKVGDKKFALVPTAGSLANGDVCVDENEKTVAVTAESTEIATWDNLPLMYQGQKITYRVVEEEQKGYKQAVYSSEAIVLKDQPQTDVTVTNTLDPTSLTVNKVWSPSVEKLEKYKALPDGIYVLLQYKDGNEWKAVPENAEQFITEKDGSYSFTYKNLNKGYKYRAIETAIVYGQEKVELAYKDNNQENGRVGNFVYKSSTVQDGDTDEFTTTITNSIEETKLVVTKTWDDEEDRDSLRNDLTVNLYRDLPENATDAQKAACLLDTVTLKAPKWTCTWTQLPMFTNNLEKESVYTVEEIQNPGYEDPKYKGNDEDDQASVILIAREDCPGYAIVDLTNIHKPVKGTISATKVWNDYPVLYDSRPEEIYLTLKYKLAGSKTDWQKVEHVDETSLKASGNYTGGGVYTTSPVSYKIDLTAEDAGDSQTRTWENLPLIVKEDKSVIYKVFETDEDGNDLIGGNQQNATLKNYDIRYSSLEGDTLEEAPGHGANQTITNTLETTSLTLSKEWIGDNGIYSKVKQTANKAMDLVRPSSLQFRVEYQESDSEWKALTYAGDTPISAQGIVTMTPDAYGNWNPIILDSLPLKNADGSMISYRVKEVADGAYDSQTEVKQNANGSWSAATKNTLQTASLELEKIWNDGNDRDGIRPESITLSLHRKDLIAGTETDLVIDTVTVAADAEGKWHYEWDNLPVYTFDGDAKAEYYVVEDEVPKYETTYTPQSKDTVLTAGRTAEIKVDNTYVPESMSVNVQKNWGNDLDKIAVGIRPESIQFELQYSTDGGENWEVFPAANILNKEGAQYLSDSSLDSSQPYMAVAIPQGMKAADLVKTTVRADDQNQWKTEWHNLTAQIQKDGNTVPVSYRVKEYALFNYNGQENVYSSVVNKNVDNKTVTIANTLDRGSLTVHKAFTRNGQSVDSDTLYALVRTYQILPARLKVTLSYQDGDNTKTEEAFIDFDDASKSYGSCTFTDLPVKDAQNNHILYTITDSAEGFGEIDYGTVESISVPKEGIDKTITNDIKTGNIQVNKHWFDENNRDNFRTPVTIELYRDDSEEVYRSWSSEGEDALKDWNCTFENLPVYKADGSGDPSVYTLKETGQNAEKYTVIWSAENGSYSITNAGQTVQADLTNRHNPDKGSISAKKRWVDYSDFYGSRPEEIWLTLKYKTEENGEWQTVEQATLTDGNYADGGVHSTSPASQKIDLTAEDAGDSQTRTWENLPLTADGKQVIYKVFETVPELKNYTIDYSSAHGDILAEQEKSHASQIITNTLDTTSLTISKQWINDTVEYKKDGKAKELVRPDRIDFYVEYSEDGIQWNALNQTGTEAVCVNGVVTLIPDEEDNWNSVTMNDLPLKTAEGAMIQYRIREAKMYFGDEVVICQDRTQNIADWSGQAGAYQGSATAVQDTQDGSWSAATLNSLETASLKVEKIWKDGNDRDGFRPTTITVKLHRVDRINNHPSDKVIDTETIQADEDGKWTYTWTNLPVYTTDGSVKATYYVVEDPVDKYTTEYQSGAEYSTTPKSAEVTLGSSAQTVTSIKIRNSYMPQSFAFSAKKNWGDDQDKIATGIRPKSIQFELEYSLDGENWNTFPKENVLNKEGEAALHDDSLDPDQVYMAMLIPEGKKAEDLVRQTITEDEEWTAHWNYLTSNVQIGSETVEVSYRVKEIALNNYNKAEIVYSKALETSGAENTVEIANKLDRASLTVEKVFTENQKEVKGDDLLQLVKEYGILPETLEITLTYQDGEKSKTETAEITFDKESKAYGTCTFENLPVKYADGTEIQYTISDNAKDFVDIAYGTVNGIVLSKDTNAIAITNNIDTGSLRVTKEWIDQDNRAGLRGPVTINVYRDGNETPYRIWKSEGDAAKTDWTHEFTNLPIYKEYKADEGSKPEYSVYTVEETGSNKMYRASWSQDGRYTLEEAGATVAAKLTNTFVPAKVLKVDKADHSKVLENAHLQIIKVADGKENIVAEWTTDKKAAEICLQPGDYILRETVAPVGYNLAEDTTFTIKEDGTVKAEGPKAASIKDGVLLVEDSKKVVPETDRCVQVFKYVTAETKEVVVKKDMTFKIGLFYDESCTDLVEAQKVVVKVGEEYGYVTFEHLGDGDYYVCEVDPKTDQALREEYKCEDPKLTFKIAYDHQKVTAAINNQEEGLPETAICTVTNDAQAPADEYFEKAKYITIEKILKEDGVEVPAGESEETFTFKVANINGTDEKTVEVAPGEKSDPIKVIKGTYSIEEILADDAQYQVTYTVDGVDYSEAPEITVDSNTTNITVSVTNDKITPDDPDDPDNPDDPVEPTNPTDSNTDNSYTTPATSTTDVSSEAAKTGDDNPMEMYILLCMAGLVLGGIGIRKKRKDS